MFRSFAVISVVTISSRHIRSAAPTNATNSGEGFSTVLLYSGWYCVPTNQGCPSTSTTSTSPVSGFDAHGLHTGTFERSHIVVVEFVTVTVTLRNMELAVGRRDFRTFLQRTGISAQPHRAALGRHPLLLFHQVDHRMGRRLHFARIRIGQTQHVACEFDHGALHTEADSQERDRCVSRA